MLATGSLDHAVRLWTPFSPQHPVACLASHTSGVVGVAIAEQPHLLFSLAQDLVGGQWLSQTFLTVSLAPPSPCSHCVYGTSQNITCSRPFPSSFPSLSGCLTLVPPPSPSSYFLPHALQSPAMSTWPDLPSMQVHSCLPLSSN